MRILYFDYTRECLAPMLRSFELAKAAVSLGHTVMLCFCHERIRQSKWFFSMLSSAQTKNFIVSFNKPFSYIPASPGEPSKIVGWKMLRSGLHALRFIVPEIKKTMAFKPDVIVARPDDVYSFLMTSFIFRVPVVLSADGPVEELSVLQNYKAHWPVYVDLWRAKKAKAILSINDVCSRLWKQKGIAEQRLFSCPNGVDPEVFRPLKTENRLEVRKELGLLPEHIVLGFCGNQRFWHGLSNFFKTFASLSAAIPDLRLLIVGALENPKAAGIDGISDSDRKKIVFTGPIEYPRMPRFMDAMDIMVMPYPNYRLFHFSPMKMFESLSMAKVMVASGQGQIRDLMQGLPSAFLYNPEDADGLGKALFLACKALKRTPSLGEASRSFVKNGHTWRDRGKQMIAACEYALTSMGKNRRVS